MSTFEHHIKITHEKTNAMDELEKVCDLSRAQLKSAIDKGALWLSKGKSTQRLRRIKKPLNIGETLHFYYNEKVLNHKVDDAILIEDFVEYSVWYKPYGMLSQGSKWSEHCTVSRWVQKYFNSERNVFIVHRLDKAATGLIIIAHTKKAAQGFSKLFENHNLNKFYRIVVHGDHRDRPQPETIRLMVDGKPAISHFTSLAYHEKQHQTLVEVKIETGRKHQIRQHAASIGYPVVGDRLHGGETVKNYLTQHDINLQLCAVKLNFTCPLSHAERNIELANALQPQLPA